MTKVTAGEIVDQALVLLDEVGLDAVTTRRLAQRLGVEQPTLYWHFRRKEDLLDAMAERALVPHAAAPLPEAGADWRAWFLENYRSFRRTLLQHRDGARLHAGSFPTADDLHRIRHKFAFLVASGLPEHEVPTAMLAASRFTVGSVLEEQSAVLHAATDDEAAAVDHEQTFEAGLRLLVEGLAQTRRAGDARR